MFYYRGQRITSIHARASHITMADTEAKAKAEKLAAAKKRVSDLNTSVGRNCTLDKNQLELC